MAESYSIADRAQLTAEGLGIDPRSYVGREADALIAMALVAGYSRLVEQDKRRVLWVIADEMRFMQSNPAFVRQCVAAIGLIIANPDWAPGSLENADLENKD